MFKIKWTRSEKSEAELEFDSLCKLYEEKFGVSFGYNVGGRCPRTIEEAVEEVRYCLEHNKTQERERQDIPKGVIY